MLLPTAGFSVRGVFRSQPVAKKTLPAWVMRVLAYSSFDCGGNWYISGAIKLKLDMLT